MRMTAVRLYESPVLRVYLPDGEEPVALSLAGLDSVKGFRQDAVHLRAVLERAAALDEAGEAARADAEAAVVEAIRLWCYHAFGREDYERVFSTPARRSSYGWHERVFLAAREALAAARADYLRGAAADPVLAALRAERLRAAADNMAAAALARERGETGEEADVGAAGEH